MKRSMADKIEQYLKVLIERSEGNRIEIQRSELAETFNCVPSQVTYVISTRFTQREGYLTESRRGGKGFVRITRFNEFCDGAGHQDLLDFFDYITELELLTPQENELLTHLMLNAFNHLSGEQKTEVFEGIKRALVDYVKMGT